MPPHELPLPLYDASPDGWGKAILSMAYPDVPMAAPEYIAAAESFDRIQTAAARLPYWLSHYGVSAADRAVVMRRVRMA